MSNSENNNNSNISSNNEINIKATIHQNLDQNILIITQDKMELILKDSLDKIEEKKSWLNPFGIALTLLITFLTTGSFKNAFGISSNVWYALFLMSMVISGFFLVKSLWKVRSNFSFSVDSIISEIKKSKPKNININLLN